MDLNSRPPVKKPIRTESESDPTPSVRMPPNIGKPQSLKVVFSGMIAADPFQGGATWAVLQYVLGLKRLGHEVLLVEPIPSSKLRPHGTAFVESQNAAYFRQVTREFGIDKSAALLLDGSTQTTGVGYPDVARFTRGADLLINVSGMLTDAALLEAIPKRVYLDLDPAFIQIWQHTYGIDMRFSAHTHFMTIGQRIGTPGCPVPTCGLQWLKTAQPIVLGEWPCREQPCDSSALTTIGNWRGYGSVEFEGRHYGQKAHSLRQFITLPRLTAERLAPAFSIHADETADITALAENGWTIQDPARVAASPASYRQFIRESKAEFGIAKSGYVASTCGWFSDRSGCYLASGRPVVAQNTGFEGFLPTGRGLFAFETMDEILGAMDEIRRDYPAHAKAARAVAEEYLDSDKVLARFLGEIGLDS